MNNFDFDGKDGEEQKEKQKIINEMLGSFQNELYYTPTIEIANLIYEKIHNNTKLNTKNYELVKELSPEDIKILLSFEL